MRIAMIVLLVASIATSARAAGNGYCRNWMTLSSPIREAGVIESLRPVDLDRACVVRNAPRLARMVTSLCGGAGVDDETVAFALVNEAKKLCP